MNGVLHIFDYFNLDCLKICHLMIMVKGNDLPDISKFYIITNKKWEHLGDDDALLQLGLRNNGELI